MGLTLLTPAASYPVTRAESKLHCRVDGTADDGLIDGLIAAATDYVEQYTGRAIMGQTWKLSLDAFSESILLPKGPVQSVTSVQYFDTNGDIQTASASLYTFDAASDPSWIVVNSDVSWPDTLDGVNAVNVTFVAGYSSVPAAIKKACLLLIGDWYRGRENTLIGTNQPMEMPHAVTALLCNYRAYA